MTLKVKIGLSIVALLTAYAIGRYASPEKIKTVTQTVEVEKKTDTTQTDLDRDKHKQTTVVEVKQPDGTQTKTTTITEDSTTTKKTDATVADNITTDTKTEKEVTYATSKVTILATYGIPLTGGVPAYGGSISKPVLGPVTIGIWGNSSGVAGLGLGLTF